MPNPFLMPYMGSNQGSKSPLDNSTVIFEKMLSLGKNPKEVEQILFNNFPQFKQIAENIGKSGMSPIDYALSEAMKRNINASPFVQKMMAMINQK